MDKFGIPKIINRHVLKAISKLQEDGIDYPSISNIYDAVKITMRNNVPVRNLHAVVVQSLNNLMDCGVIEGNRSNFLLRNSDANLTGSGENYQDSEMSEPNEREMDSGSDALGSKATLPETSSEGDLDESPRKSRRPSESELGRLSSGEMDSDEVDQLRVDMPNTFQVTERPSSFVRNLANFQNNFKTQSASEMITLTSWNYQANDMNDQNLKIVKTNMNSKGLSSPVSENANPNSVDLSSPVPGDDDMKNTTQINDMGTSKAEQ